jgi:hypothetical protein
MFNRDVIEFIRCAIEASIYAAPRAPGLTHDEIREVAERAGYRPGEIADATHRACSVQWPDRRFGIQPQEVPVDFIWKFDPEYRSIDAFEFVSTYLRDLAREVGGTQARADRDVIVATGVARGLTAHDLEVTLTMLILARRLIKSKDGAYECATHNAHLPMPSEQRANAPPVMRNVPQPGRRFVEHAYNIVKDVVARRTDGRAPAAEPIKAFEYALDGLDCARVHVPPTAS